MTSSYLPRTLLAVLLLCASLLAQADVSRIEISERVTLSDPAVTFTYERIEGVVHFTLDPSNPADLAVTDLQYAPRNDAGLVEYSADFRLLVPSAEIANGDLLYHVNNRGNSTVPPEVGLTHPLSALGYTYLITGWINELSPQAGRIRLHAPIVGSAAQRITGDVRYEVITSAPETAVNIAGAGHLGYPPTEQGLREASLTRRLYPLDPRVPVEHSRFSLAVQAEPDSNQPVVTLNLADGFEPGVIYELIYQAQDPVLAGAGMAGIRDLVSLLRYDADAPSLAALALPRFQHAVAWGNSQSGRLLRQFLYDGFNADLAGRIVFDGVIPVIAGGGRGMFNNRFAMPTRTNGQEANQLYPNDLFPFTYGESTDPFTGRTDSILARAHATNTVPKIMHIQTSNEYWLRAGSLPHTNPEGTADAVIPEGVRFYTIGGSQHGSGNGVPQPPRGGQLPPNPNLWAPIEDSLIVAMVNWVAHGTEPPASRYPRIVDGTLVPSHVKGRINPDAWNALYGVKVPEEMYLVGLADWGDRWWQQHIIDRHPSATTSYYQSLVPAVDTDNNDLAGSTILPPLTQVPLGTFVSWNLRAEATGAPRSLARLSGGYIPFPANTAVAVQSRDPRNSIAGLYGSFADYLAQYEAATDRLIAEGYLLPGFKATYMAIARGNANVFE
jgi:hypothetical protein